MNTKIFKPGDKVIVTKEGLIQHARSVPPQAGYDSATFKWRQKLSKLCDNRTIGTVENLGIRVVSETASGIDVDFNGDLLWVPIYMVQPVSSPGERIKELLQAMVLMCSQSDESIQRLYKTNRKTAFDCALKELETLKDQLPD